MCGIFCILSYLQNSDISPLFNEFKLFENLISRRGPNCTGTEFCKLTNCNLFFASSVLWLQGNEMTTQPIKDNNSVFAYNGDVFGGIISEELRIEKGDTQLFLENIKNSDNISKILHDIQGPYSFIYLNLLKNKLYFGRDIYGRRSLLIGKKTKQFIITSVAKRNTPFDFIELPSIGTFSIDLGTADWQIFPWKSKNRNFEEKLKELELFLDINISISSNVEYDKITHFSAPDQNNLRQLINDILNQESDTIFDYLSNSWSNTVEKLQDLLENAIKKRISTQPKFCQNCFKQYNCNHCTTGVLFSGGVDCAVLALLANKFTDLKRPIDLINVSFDEAKRYETPDRLTGIQTFNELQKLCPERIWNFIEVNVTKTELDSCRSEYIADLIYPLKSILDDSLGCALWFASRASTENYTSPCRVLLVGMGADELFGGYSRHRIALQRRNWQGLHEALDEDWQNLPYRNLARDDRVVSDHGRQLRTPYLDEEVVKFIRNLNSWEKTFPIQNLPQGIGEKILLRTLAYRLGLRNAATLKKRALQFGSRIANPKEKAHETSSRL